jgi:hypothetical protein
MSHLRYFCWFVALVIVAGCQSTDDPPLAASATVEAAAPAATQPSEAGGTARNPELADPKATPAVVAEFKPPFPEREMFEPPKRAQSMVRRDDEHGQTVELKGFINVDQPRVVLSIDGTVTPVPEGGEKYGVQVISIQPPKVVLQRGRSRWTATLE